MSTRRSTKPWSKMRSSVVSDGPNQKTNSMIECLCDQCKRFFLWKRGQGVGKFCSRLCACRSRNTKKHQRTTGKAGGATKITLRGSGSRGYIKELGRHQHRVRIEIKLGRRLTSSEVVHHLDGNKHNNSLRNLKVVSRAEHINLHREQINAALRSRK